MRMFRLTAAYVAALIFATLAPPAGMAVPVVTQPVFTLSSPSTPAGSPETFVITRVAGGAGVYVLFQTTDDTAKAGIDYTATKQLIYLKGSTKTATVIVPTFVNSGSTVPLKFNAIIANTAIPVRATGTIVEPTQTCPDGSVIAAAAACPAPPPAATQTCPDGSIIPATSACPAPPPPTQQWVLAPAGTAVYARCKTVGGCHSTSAPCPYTTGLNPPAVCPVPNIIAQQGEVREYRWGGCDAAQPCRREADLWPLGHYPKTSGVASDWFLGLSGWEDEWEGVVPAS